MSKSRDAIKPLFVRYVVVGAGSYTLELSLLLGLHHLLGMNRTLSTAVSFWFGLAMAFLLQKLVAFRDSQKSVRAISGQIGAYALLTIVNYSFTVGVVSLFSDDWIIISRTLAIGCTTVWNFFIYRKIFKIENPEISA